MSLKNYKQSRFFKSIIRYFLQGLFYTAPLAVTLYVMSVMIVEVDSLIDLDYPGMGILLIIVFITLVGYLGSTYLIGYLRPFERLIENTPLIKVIYSSMKDVMNAFIGSKKQFKHPVLVKINRKEEVERLGFVTKDDLTDIGIAEDKVAVYLPFSYAISGEVLIVPRSNITPINASSADIMKLVVSGGVTKVDTSKKNSNSNETTLNDD